MRNNLNFFICLNILMISSCTSISKSVRQGPYVQTYYGNSTLENSSHVEYNKGETFSLLIGNSNEGGFGTARFGFFYEFEISYINHRNSMFHKSDTPIYYSGGNVGFRYPWLPVGLGFFLGAGPLINERADNKIEAFGKIGVDLNIWFFKNIEPYGRIEGGKTSTSNIKYVSGGGGLRYFY